MSQRGDSGAKPGMASSTITSTTGRVTASWNCDQAGKAQLMSGSSM